MARAFNWSTAGLAKKIRRDAGDIRAEIVSRAPFEIPLKVEEPTPPKSRFSMTRKRRREQLKLQVLDWTEDLDRTRAEMRLRAAANPLDPEIENLGRRVRRLQHLIDPLGNLSAPATKKRRKRRRRAVKPGKSYA